MGEKGKRKRIRKSWKKIQKKKGDKERKRKRKRKSKSKSKNKMTDD